MVTCTLRILASPERRGEILHTIRSVLGPTEVQPGCISCRVLQDADDPNALTLIEEWESQTDLDRHLRSCEYDRILAVMDMACEPPEMKLSTASNTSGIEAVRAARMVSEADCAGRSAYDRKDDG